MTYANPPTALDRIFAALGNRVNRSDLERRDLPVKLIHDDVVPVRGSVLIATHRLASRVFVDAGLDKLFKR